MKRVSKVERKKEIVQSEAQRILCLPHGQVRGPLEGHGLQAPE
jgi:hypothetical protein